MHKNSDEKDTEAKDSILAIHTGCEYSYTKDNMTGKG